MSFSIQKNINVTIEDFIEQDALYHAEFSGKNGNPCLVQILRDYDVESPREWDNLWTWVTTPIAGYSDVKPEYHKESRKSYCQKYYYRPEDFENCNGCIDREFAKTHMIVPLYLYRHSGDVICAGHYDVNWPDKQWDAGCMGFAFVSYAKLKEESNCRCITKKVKERAMECLEGEVAAMNVVNFGEVYGIKIINMETEEQDSCWGFFCPEINDLKSCVANMLDGWLDKEKVYDVIGGLIR